MNAEYLIFLMFTVYVAYRIQSHKIIEINFLVIFFGCTRICFCLTTTICIHSFPQYTLPLIKEQNMLIRYASMPRCIKLNEIIYNYRDDWNH